MPHPTIFKLIDGLKQQQSLTAMNIEKSNTDEPIAASRENYVYAAKYLKPAVSKYGNRSTLDYLRGVAHNLTLNL